MRTYFSLFLGLCLAVVSFSSCKKSSDDNNNNPNPVYPPTSIFANSLTYNNINTAAAGTTIYDVYAEMYGSNVLLAKFNGVSMSNLPATQYTTGVSTFAYANFKEYDLKFYGTDIAGQLHNLGSVHLALKDYSSDTYPQPVSLFFNSNGFAGTLELGYIQ